MDILNKSISSFSFDDVVSFCATSEPEGYQLDYKKDLPSKGLAKHVAAFANSRGGVLVIGVEEDTKTGKPANCEGIIDDGKLKEWVYQQVANVQPLPWCEVNVTDEKNGKVFLLVRVFEGDQTPYYPQNDANIWVRTGNISKSIELASPDAAELLFGKKEKAALARSLYISRAEEVYNAALQRAEKDRLRLLAEERAKHQRFAKQTGQASPQPFVPSYVINELSTNVTMSTVVLQPYFPHKTLITPQELKGVISEKITVSSTSYSEFPHSDCEAIPDGVLRFWWGPRDGRIMCEELFAAGLVFNKMDVLGVDEKGLRSIWLSSLAVQLYMSLRASGNFYKHTGYQGGVIGSISLDDVTDTLLRQITISGQPEWLTEQKMNLLPKYRWEIETTTTTLNDEIALQAFWIDKIKEIYWSFGYESVSEPVLRAFLKQHSLE